MNNRFHNRPAEQPAEGDGPMKEFNEMQSQGHPKLLNPLRERWARGEPTFGAIVTMPSIQVVQVLANAGLDWLIIDMEHGPIDLAAAHAMIVATAGTATVPFVRIAWAVPWLAKPLLDLGAMGIVFPMILSAGETSTAVRSVRYPPDGDRLWGPFYAPVRWGQSMADYIRGANREVLSVVTIEHPDAVNRIDEICATPGLDLAFIGPGDLAMSLGHPGEFEHPDVAAAMAKAEAGILRSRVAAGGVARSVEEAKRMTGRGYRAMVLGFDWSLLHRGVSGMLEALR
jgi:4-hydroxy-2-oxoheptanedioate aldolase